MGCFLFSTFIAISAFLFIQNASASEFVPVYTWETSKSNEIVPAIGHVNKATFKEILLQKIEKTNPFIVVFAEQNLSPEDFVVDDKKTFQHISNLGATSKVSYLPLVESPVDAFKDLQAKETVEVSINDIKDITELPQAKILIVNFNDAKDDEDRIDMLRRHDEIIIDVYNKLKQQHKNVLAVLTGFHSSWIVPEDIKNQRQSRSVLAAENPNFRNTDKFYIYLEQVVIKDDKSENVYKLDSISGTEDNEFTVMFNGSEGIKMKIEENLGYWYVKTLNLTSSKDGVETQMYAPLKFSYHCSNYTVKVGTKSIELIGFEVQYLNTKETVIRFGDAYDCVGFTTIPIWSGLFVTFILIIIMTIGLTMMMDIKTMDRFDDPKGKTIIVNSTE